MAENKTTSAEKINEKIDEHLLGTKGQESNKKITATQAKVFSTISRVRELLASDGIEDSVSDNTNLFRVLSSEDDKLEKANDPANPSFSKQIELATKSIDKSSDISTIFAGEETRLQNYQVYEQISEYIVQIMEAAETYADNILSPDTFNNTSLPITIEKNQVNEDVRNRIYQRMSDLNELYDIHGKLENAIKNSIVLGDYFITSLDLRRRLTEVLSEDKTMEELENYASDSAISKADISAVLDSFSSEAKAINEGYTITGEFKTLNEDNKEFANLSEETLVEGIAEFLQEVCVVSEDTSQIAKALKDKENIYNSDIVTKIAEKKKLKASEKVKLNKNLGSLVKEYHPKDVIKITDGNLIFGYILIDYHNTAYTAANCESKNSVYRNMADTFSANSNNTPTSKKYIDIITKTIVKKVKLNPKIITDNTDLADIIYDAIVKAKAGNKQFSVTFAHPNEVHHFKPSNNIYGKSVLDKVKFFAKLYVGVLTNAFMTNAVRKNERLAYYIDVAGSDNDSFNSIQDLIRTIKQREVKFNNLNSISSVLNTAGEFHDFFIPTANGNRPIDIEPISLGQPKDIDSTFIEFLKRNIITGIGVPAAYISALEEVEFARSLTMENGKFLRRIIRLQGIFSKPATSLIREIYENEFISPADKENKEKAKKEKAPAKKNAKISDEEQLANIETNIFKITFPTPTTLSITVQEEQLQAASTQADTLTEIEIDEENTELQREFKRLIIRKLIPSIDWKEIDTLRTEAERNVAKRKGPPAEDEEDADEASGGFGRQF